MVAGIAKSGRRLLARSKPFWKSKPGVGAESQPLPVTSSTRMPLEALPEASEEQKATAGSGWFIKW